ncbi:MAG TPA: DNA cytosine methyltransferase, partial [Cyanophyceae cyanobacterium]
MIALQQIYSGHDVHYKPPHFATRPKPVLPSDAPTLVTAFTCGGLFDIGAMYAGFQPILGVECYPAKGKKDDKVKQAQSAAAADSYELNIGGHILRKTIEEAVRDRDFTFVPKPDAFHCSPSCTNLSQGNTKGAEDAGDISAARAVVDAIAQLQFPKIFTLENVRQYQKSESWQIIREALYQYGYGVSEEVVCASDYGDLETGEGVPQDRVRFIVRAVLGQMPPPLPMKVPNRMGWLQAIGDLLEDLPDGELAPWQLKRLPTMSKDLLSANSSSGAILVDGRNERSVCFGTSPSPTVSNFYKGANSVVLLNGQNASNPTAPHKLSDEPAFSVTAGAKWAKVLLVERAGASDSRITTKEPQEPAWTLRSSIGTDQDGRNRNELMNVVAGERVKTLNARAIARLQSVPDWYILPQEIRFAGPLLGNGVPPLLSEAILRGLRVVLEAEGAEGAGEVGRAGEAGEAGEVNATLTPPAPVAPSAPPALFSPLLICGVDESKRGTYFGPLVACAYIPHPDRALELQQLLSTKGKLRDSKQLSKAKRRELLPQLKDYGTWRIGYATVAEITQFGTDKANQLAMLRAIKKLPFIPHKVLVDGNKVLPGIENQTCIPQGDSKEYAIAGASILVKEWSDDLVERLGAKLPHRFKEHHGYSGGGKLEDDMRRFGVSHPQFRRSYSSVRSINEDKTMVATPIAFDAELIADEIQDLSGHDVQYKILSKESDEQYTPNTPEQPVVDLVAKALGGKIGVDVTADAGKNVPADYHITKEQDYLKTSIKGMGAAFMNCPYSNPYPFVEKITSDYASGDIPCAIALLKSGTAHNQKTGELIREHAIAQCQWGAKRGVSRIGFIKDGTQRLGADFDCTLYYFGDNFYLFQQTFEPWGLVSLLPAGQALLDVSGEKDQALNRFFERNAADEETVPVLQVDPELEAFIPPLSQEEFKQLEANILEQGCLEPIDIWGDVIVDGHNRYKICTKHGILFQVRSWEFANKDAAKLWMINKQLGRRNFDETQQAYFRGLMYLLEKKTHGGNKLGGGKTAERIAKNTGVTERTVRRNANFAEAVTTLTETLPNQPIKDLVFNGTIDRKQCIDLAKIALTDPEKAAEEVELFKATERSTDDKLADVPQSPPDLSSWKGAVVTIKGYGKDSKNRSLRAFDGKWVVVIDVREWHL